MANCRATYSDDLTEIEFTAVMTETDYGVPGSPTFEEIEEVEIETLTIGGTEVDVKTLPITVINIYLSLADELEFVHEDAG